MAQIGVALRCFRVLLGIFTIVGCSGASAAPNIAPSDVVAQLQAALLDTMKRGEVLEFNGRYRALLPTIDDSFDLPQMTRVAVGSRWDQIMPALPQAQHSIRAGRPGLSTRVSSRKTLRTLIACRSMTAPAFRYHSLTCSL